MGICKSDLKQVPSEWKKFLSLIENATWALEVGTFRGKGTIGLCNVVKNVITVDLDDRRVSKPKGSIFIKGNSHDPTTLKKIKEILGDNVLDVLFIDGDHSYSGVKEDFALYNNLVHPGGIIGLHDIVDSEYHRRKDCFVSDFWNEIKTKYKNKEIVDDGNWAGIGVLWK